MRNKTFLWFLGGLLLLLANACQNNEAGFSIDWPEGAEISMGAEMGASQTLDLSAEQSWTTRVSGNWLEVSPSGGEAGNYELTLKATKPNDTGETRTATLTISSGDMERKITVSQDEYIRVEETTLNLDADGGVFEIHFYTSLTEKEIGVFTLSNCDWLTSPPETRAAGEVQEWVVALYAKPNETFHSRTTTIYFGKIIDEEQSLGDGNLLATMTITQMGVQSGGSTDFSKDKEVRVIQQATRGEGIPLVLMGDGFIDKEIDNGYYDEVMDQTVENLFTEEPIRSLKDYFDIYAVTVVSPTNVFDEERNTALECWMEGGNSTKVEGNDESVQDYAAAVEGIDLNETQVVVILNSDAYAGTNYNYWLTNGKPLNFSVAYCPVIENLESENFRRVLVHETVGHGIGKLDDEYSYETQGAMPQSEIDQTRQQQEDFGWWMNVDFTSDPQLVLWSDFLYDERYDGQGLGVFEGACTYWTGAYRSTEESMMRSNTMGFNAPSRRAIYTNIVQRGEGRTPSLEEFIDFDQQTYVPQTRAAAGAPSRPFARPRVIQLEHPLGE